MVDNPVPYIVSPNNTAPTQKRTTGGRTTHFKLAENFAEVFAKRQAEEIQKVMQEQVQMFDKSIYAHMEEQRRWEKEMMEKEQQHQMLLLDKFMIGLKTVQTGNIQYPQYIPTQIPMHTFPSTASTPNVYSYHLSPSPSSSCSPPPSSPFPAVPSPLPSPTILQSSVTVLTSSSSCNDDNERST
ncbi:PREDICTED: uncharacterized protein LOC105571201 [Vollenhovia emeryi]|uniref:uncharacterized protein LOC105571201 n=1 Tax=Vollenhovia emeryi TaxID=411798 RepID=UPI0005F576C4|nr:PREDICTED: uncharacterized protein LOC105571201 [Vollenhovia emeryi]